MATSQRSTSLTSLPASSRSLHHAPRLSLLGRLRQRPQQWRQSLGQSMALLRSEYPDKTMIGKEVAMMLLYVIGGWNDATPGALLPSIEDYYEVGFTIVSLLFVCNFCGNVVAAWLTPFLIDRFGLGIALTFFAALVTVPWGIYIALPPYPVFALCFFFTGIGTAAMDSIGNAWMSHRPRSAMRLGVLHFNYGIGAFLSPLAAAPFNEGKVRFSYFYILALSLAFVNLSLVIGAFRFKREDDDLDPKESPSSTQDIELSSIGRPDETRRDEKRTPGEDSPDATLARAEAPATVPVLNEAVAPVPAVSTQSTHAKFKVVLKNPQTHIFAIFTLLYVGTEVSIGGWTSTFLLDQHTRPPAESNISRAQANYLVAGFWAGIAAGRILLLPVTSWIGSQLSVPVYLGIALALQLVNWLVPQIVTNALSLVIMGLVLGPIYPIMIGCISRRIRPRSLHTTVISFVGSFGGCGSALMPFIIGLVAQQRGIKILAPTLVALLAALTGIWLLLGNPLRKEEEDQRND